MFKNRDSGIFKNESETRGEPEKVFKNAMRTNNFTKGILKNESETRGEPEKFFKNAMRSNNFTKGVFKNESETRGEPEKFFKNAMRSNNFTKGILKNESETRGEPEKFFKNAMRSNNFTEGVFKIQNFIVFSFTMINTLKLYHWTTNIYSRHKSIDDLIDKLQNLIDSFVESYLGKKESETRGDSIEIFKNNFDLTINIINDNTIKNEINNYMKYIKKCCNDLNSNTDTELINILDEISSSLNTGIYLSNLK